MLTSNTSFQSQNRQSNLFFAGFIFLSILIHSWALIEFPELTLLKPGFTSTATLNIELSKTHNTSLNNKKDTVKKPDSEQSLVETPFADKNQLKSHIPINEEKTAAKKQPAPVKKNTPVETPSITEPIKTSTPASAQDDLLYLEKIYKKIESNKYYPQSAKKRGMQDIVTVSFEILSGGSIANLNIESRFKPLRVAAKKAINESLPFDAIPESVKTPLKIQYAMAFSLQ